MDEENLTPVTENTESTQNNAPVEEEKKGMSIASLILGILSLVLLCFWYFSLPCAIIAIILGAIGRKKGGKGMGTAGIVLGSIAIAIGVIMVIFAVIGFGALASNPDFLEALESSMY